MWADRWGGIGGMQWFFDPTNTTLIIDPGPKGPDDFVPGREMVLEGGGQPRARRVKLALDLSGSYDEVLAALTVLGVHV
jgi:hypothetical protein